MTHTPSVTCKAQFYFFFIQISVDVERLLCPLICLPYGVSFSIQIKSNPLSRQLTETQFLELHYSWVFFISNLELYFSWDGGSISKGFLIN